LEKRKEIYFPKRLHVYKAVSRNLSY